MKKKIRIEINKEECLGKWCAICAEVCPNDAIKINDVAVILDDKCNRCRKCTKNVCPNYAISIADDKKGV